MPIAHDYHIQIECLQFAQMLKQPDDGQYSDDEPDFIEQEDSDLIEEDKSDVIEDEPKSQQPLESSFRKISSLAQSKHQQQSVLHTRQLNKSLEMMFILFSVYKEDLVRIAAAYNCSVKISINKLKIQSNDTEQQFEFCCTEIVKYLQKIMYEQLTISTNHLIYRSPYLTAEALKFKVSMTKFNNKIYLHSNELKIEDLKRVSDEIFKGKFIFTVYFKKPRFENREIYDHLRGFLKMTLSKHRPEFEKRNVKMEIDMNENGLNFIGERQRDNLAAKNTFKNILSSTVVLIFKYHRISSEFNNKLGKAKLYCESICSYPVYLNRFMSTCVVLISKENILKNLLRKKKLSEYMGLHTEKVEIGMFLVKNYTYFERKENIIRTCSKKGYDFTNLNNGVYNYFRKIFLQEEEKSYDIDELIKLVIEVLEDLQVRKEKFDIPEIKNIIRQNQEIEVMHGQYYETGDISEDQLISNQLRRTVMSENLRMSKLSLVKYNVCTGQETPQIYWFDDGDSKVQLDPTKFKIGIQYFKGKYKQDGSQKIYFYQHKLTVL